MCVMAGEHAYTALNLVQEELRRECKGQTVSARIS